MDWIERNGWRFLLLCLTGLTGFALSESDLVAYLLTTGGNRYQDSVTLLMLGLPGFVSLGFFRNNDVMLQIEKSAELLERANAQMRQAELFQATQLIFSEHLHQRVQGLLELKRLRHKLPEFSDRIDRITSNKLNFQKADLSGEDLFGMNLNEAELIETNFTFCCLERTLFVGATIQHTSFSDSILTGAALSKVRESNLNFTGAKLTRCRFMGAQLDEPTFNNITNWDGTDFSSAALRGPNFDGYWPLGAKFKATKTKERSAETKKQLGYFIQRVGEQELHLE